MAKDTYSADTVRMHAVIGASVHKYSRVEAAQVAILEGLLKVGTASASILLFSVQNVRTRNEMIEGLLQHYHGDKLQSFWAEFSAFLSTLAVYRNAIVHWHPGWRLHFDDDRKVKQITDLIADPKRLFRN
jgi:hypothetical protein